MGDVGWTLAKGDRVASKRPYHIIYQLYAPVDSKPDEIRQMFGVCVELTPPDPLDEALCACIYASFSESRSAQELWNNWEKMPEVAAAIGWTQSPRDLMGPLSQRCFTKAPLEARLSIMKLCDIVSRDAVQGLMIEPVLGAAAIKHE